MELAPIAISSIGILLVVLGLLGLLQPHRLLQLIEAMRSRDRSNVRGIAAIRITAGVLFFVAAPQCAQPAIVNVIGAAAIVAGIGVLILGPERFDATISWWEHLPPIVVRLSAIVLGVFGALVYWAGGWQVV